MNRIAKILFVTTFLTICSNAEATPVNGGENLTTTYAIPKVISSGTLGQGSLLLDETNHRIYFDGGVQTKIVGGTSQSVFISGNHNMTDGATFYSSVAGTINMVLYSSKATGAVGGAAFKRSGSGATIGQGWQTGEGATWDLDLLGTGSGVGSGYDMSFNNKNISGSLRLGAGNAVIFGNGIGEVVDEKARIDGEGLKLVSDTRLVQAAPNVAAAGSSQSDATTLVYTNTIATACDSTKGLKLPNNPEIGDQRRIINSVDGCSCKVYPYLGASINAHSTNDPVVVLYGAFCIAETGTKWRCLREDGL